MPGPAPKPTRLKLIAGNPGKRKLNESEPEYKPGATPPDWLDDRARKEWDKLARELESVGLLTSVDANQFGLYCQAVADYEDLLLRVRNEGWTTTTSNGNIVQHPAVGAMNKAAERVHKYSQQFGFTPASRTRVQTNPDNSANPDADLLE